MTSAIDRFKMRLATAIERICVLEAELEQRDARIAELEDQIASLEIDTTDSDTDNQEAQ